MAITAAVGREAPQREIDVLRRALQLVRQRLPPEWTMTVDEDVLLGTGRADAVLDLIAPWGDRLSAVVEVKRLVMPRDVDRILHQLRQCIAALGRPAVAFVIARYLPLSVRTRLEAAGASYADSTGNMHLVSARPGILVRDRGADSDPWRGPGRPLGTLKGGPAGRIVRALLDHVEPMGITRLVSVSGASTGATYRVVTFLEEQELVSRDELGRVRVGSWRRLLDRWSEEYSFGALVSDSRYLTSRGLPAFRAVLAATDARPYALTGSMAAAHWAPYAPSRLAMVYVDDPDAAAVEWRLRRVEAGTNVVLARPASEVVFQRTVMADGVVLAAPSQVAVDLRSGPGRNPAEADHLMDWMEEHEPAWRR